jgi:hypothetical protein
MWMATVLVGTIVSAERQFSRQPTDTMATVGEVAVLRCGVEPAGSGMVQVPGRAGLTCSG